MSNMYNRGDPSMQQSSKPRMKHDVQYTQRKWLEQVFAKWKVFLSKMGTDAKADEILQRPYKLIYQTITNIYNNDGKSLAKWINEEYLLDNSAGDSKGRDDLNISSWKEKFKTILSLDIWIEKLALWQASGYKLEMPKREDVDSLRWNMILSAKLKETLRGRPTAPRPSGQQAPNPKMCREEEMFLRGQEPRRGKYCNGPQKPLNGRMEDPNSYRPLKQKKLSESHVDIRNESIISTEKASDISALVKPTKRVVKKPRVDMDELFKKIETLKNNVKQNIEDDSAKSIIQLSSLDSSRIWVTQWITFIDEYNSRPSKIIENWLKNVQMHGKNKPKYTPIKQEIYTSQIPLKRPQ